MVMMVMTVVLCVVVYVVVYTCKGCKRNITNSVTTHRTLGVWVWVSVGG